MRRVFFVLLIVIAAGLVLMLAAGLAVRAVLGGSGKDALLSSIGDTMGVPLTVARAEFDLAQWFRLRPSVSLEDVTVRNPAGFGGPYLLAAKKLSAQVSLLSLLGKKIEAH